MPPFPISFRKHIVFAHTGLAYGGAERVLIEQVASLSDQPIRISILFMRNPEELDIVPELRARNPNIDQIRFLPEKWPCYRWLLWNRPDAAVVCAHTQFLKGLRHASRLRLHCPAMVTLHERYPNQLDCYKTFVPIITDRMLCFDFRQEVLRIMGPGRHHVVNPLYPRPSIICWGREERMAARRQMGLPEDALVVGYIGRHHINKEPWKVLLFAKALEAKLGRSVHVLFAGHETSLAGPIMDKAVMTSGMGDRILRLGKTEDTGPAFRSLDLYVLASYQEGFFPLTLIEAMERGVPVATTTVGGIPTVLQDGRGGFLIHKQDDQRPVPEEAILDAAQRVATQLRDPALWQRQRELAAQRIQELLSSCDAHILYRRAFLGMLAC